MPQCKLDSSSTSRTVGCCFCLLVILPRWNFKRRHRKEKRKGNASKQGNGRKKYTLKKKKKTYIYIYINNWNANSKHIITSSLAVGFHCTIKKSPPTAAQVADLLIYQAFAPTLHLGEGWSEGCLRRHQIHPVFFTWQLKSSFWKAIPELKVLLFIYKCLKKAIYDL